MGESALFGLPTVGDTTDPTVPIVIAIVAAIVIVIGIVLIVRSRKRRGGR
ncbi:hypothetical protein I3I95_05215 [bacterium]|nr:hypothetical protein [bacterium]